MNGFEKVGLLIVIAFYTSVFPESWKGGEIIIFLFGWTMFMFGKYIEEIVTAFRTV